MILPKHFQYPHYLGPDEVCARIDAVLGRSPNADVLMDPRHGLTHGLFRWCLEYDLNPAWPLIRLQLERSLLGRKSTQLQDWLYAFGYVGTDGPGTVNKRWNGLELQGWLCIHQSAWIVGFGVADCYGVELNLRPGATRWRPAAPEKIQMYGDPGVPGAMYTPTDLVEHIVYTYTPHFDAKEKASAALHQFVPEFE